MYRHFVLNYEYKERRKEKIIASALSKSTVRQSLIIGLSGRISCVFSHAVPCKLKYMTVYQIFWKLSNYPLVWAYLKARSIDIGDLFLQYGV